jgi:hypothetical protein
MANSEIDEPFSGPAWLADLEGWLGIGILVQSIDEEPEFRIRALFMFAQHSETVTVTGSTEAEAWPALARQAIAWRTTDDKHVPLWWAGGAGV